MAKELKNTVALSVSLSNSKPFPIARKSLSSFSISSGGKEFT